jgi:Ca2+-binding RTX toxin-like protein
MVYVPGSAGDDINPPLAGSDGGDLIDGMGGNDWLFPFKRSAGGNQFDTVDGGDGVDRLFVNMVSETQQVTALQSLGGYEVKSLSENYWVVADRIESVSIVGGEANDLLQGLNGDDILSGSSGKRHARRLVWVRHAGRRRRRRYGGSAVLQRQCLRLA